MNNKGFTLIELLSTIVVLSIIGGITLVIVRGDFGKAKEKMEEVFVDTIKDALNIYLNSDAKNLSFSSTSCKITKRHGVATVESAVITMDTVINSTYKPITQSDLVNPANKDVDCANGSSISITIYRDSDYVYYYSVNKADFACLKNIGGDYENVIKNLPEGYTCS